MKAKKIFFTLLAAAVFMLLSITAWAASPAFMEVEGEQQGNIEGSSNVQGREGAIIVYAFGHSINIPRDVTSGLPTGRRVHAPFKILKEFDKSSPKLYRALTTGELLTKVTVKFYRISPEGQEEHYFTIELENAIIANISPSMPTTFLSANEPYRHMETVSFVYQNIKWTWVPDGVESEDSWAVPK
jgi:type VI secretion system secreted protein Hcp